jgi:hypothetical protein
MIDERRQQPDRRSEPRGGDDRRRRVTSEKVCCPECGSGQSRVLPVHLAQLEDGYERLRVCGGCQGIYRTIERAVLSPHRNI